MKARACSSYQVVVTNPRRVNYSNSTHEEFPIIDGIWMSYKVCDSRLWGGIQKLDIIYDLLTHQGARTPLVLNSNRFHLDHLWRAMLTWSFKVVRGFGNGGAWEGSALLTFPLALPLACGTCNQSFTSVFIGKQIESSIQHWRLWFGDWTD